MSVRGTLASAVFGLLTRSDLDLRAARRRLDRLGVRHAELSALLSVDDAPGMPNARLLDLAARLIPRARRASLPLLRERRAPPYILVWPGEHYCLLEALCAELAPKLVVEVGTYTGWSALAMLPVLARTAQLVTFDVLPWETVPGSLLRASDFESGVLRQELADIGDLATARRYRSLLAEADVFFVDAAKDGVLERRILENLETIGLKPGALVIFDDIRLWNMLSIWRDIRHPKLDLTSFGHWTGTGFIDWHGKAAND
jgi:predicted O-methyltransferase YrrM